MVLKMALKSHIYTKVLKKCSKRVKMAVFGKSGKWPILLSVIGRV